LIVLLIVGMAIIYLYRHTILKFFLGSSTPPKEVSPSVTDTVTEENNEIKVSPVERHRSNYYPNTRSPDASTLVTKIIGIKRSSF
jgi:hypothetical protein